MPQVNLTALSGQELRQRLDSSRARGDAALAYEILREMATRREAETARRPRARRRAGEPHLVEVDLDDTGEADDLPPMPHWRAPEMTMRDSQLPTFRPVEAEDGPVQVKGPAPDADPAPAREPEPLTLWADGRYPTSGPAGAPDMDLRMGDEDGSGRRARERPGFRVAAGFVVGITAGVALGWFGGDLVRETPRGNAPIEVASQAIAPPPTPAPTVMDVSLAEPEPAAVMAAPVEGDPPPANAEALAPPVEVVAPPLVSAEAPVLATNDCAAEPTPADRTICGDTELQRLQRDLRRAYAEALAAHEDRALLRERQLAWREARNAVSEPEALARLYGERIARLNGAAAQARAQR